MHPSDMVERHTWRMIMSAVKPAQPHIGVAVGFNRGGSSGRKWRMDAELEDDF